MFIEFQEVREDEIIRIQLRPENIVGAEEDRDQCTLWVSYPQAYMNILVNHSFEEVKAMLNGSEVGN